MGKIRQEFGISLGPGTTYPILFSLTEKGIIMVREEGNRKMYSLTPKGESLQQKLANCYQEIVKELKENFKNGNGLNQGHQATN